jgi:hypothetical protein
VKHSDKSVYYDMERTGTGDSYPEDYCVWNLKPHSLAQLNHASEESIACTIMEAAYLL